MTIVRQGRDTMLVAGVPHSRGTPVHYEHHDDIAFTAFDKGGKVEEIHTPHDQPLVRIHELMHARHTNRRRYDRVYKGMPDMVGQLLEDCRIHTRHWPWQSEPTPASVKKAINDYQASESKNLAEQMAQYPDLRGAWVDFGFRLRMVAVRCGEGSYGSLRDLVAEADFAPGQDRLARQLISLLERNKETKAVELVKIAFGLETPKPPFRISGGGGGDGFNPDPKDTTPVICLGGIKQPEMEIIELPKSEHVEGASIGERRATMGSRMYRPALRRPLLPQRLFVRRTPTEPGGTILIDASGSMGDFDYIETWCQRAPFGTIAYYAGDGHTRGWLYVYARDGRKAAEIVKPKTRGNTVDGPAMTWLMQQPGPRTFVTDREFCDVTDSNAQVARLAQLEGAGEVVVVNYHRDDE